MSTSASKPVHPEFVVAMRGYDRLQVDEYVARLIEWMDDAQTRTEQAEADLALTRQETASLRQQVRAMQEESLVGGRPAVDAAGSTLASVIEGALGEAHEIRSRAQADAERLLNGIRSLGDELDRAARDEIGRAFEAATRFTAQATAEATEVVAAARAEADELLDQARAEREALVASAQRTSQRLARRSERRQQEIEEVVASLEQRRRALVDEMARLRAALGAAIDSSADHTSVLAAGEIEGPAVDEAPAAGLPPGRPEATAAG